MQNEAHSKKDDFFSHLEAHYRQCQRRHVRIRCEAEIVLRNWRIVSSGTVTIKNVGTGGALLENFKFKKPVLPLKPFWIRLRLLTKKFHGITIICKPVRIITDERFGIGVKFRDVKVEV